MPLSLSSRIEFSEKISSRIGSLSGRGSLKSNPFKSSGLSQVEIPKLQSVNLNLSYKTNTMYAVIAISKFKS